MNKDPRTVLQIMQDSYKERIEVALTALRNAQEVVEYIESSCKHDFTDVRQVRFTTDCGERTIFEDRVICLICNKYLEKEHTNDRTTSP